MAMGRCPGSWRLALRLLAAGVLPLAGCQAETIQVDATLNAHPISPRIYGVAFATQAELSDLGATMNRHGGNTTSRYNWQLNASNHASDWYFESIADGDATAGGVVDSLIQGTINAQARNLITVSMIGYVATLGSSRGKSCSFSQAKYGTQTADDSQWYADAGNGILASNGTDVVNDPTDADTSADATFQQGWIQHLVATWGTASAQGVPIYCLDNESSIWHQTHRDVHPLGATMDEIGQKMVAYATMIKGVDPSAQVSGPEEWGWDGYLYSGADQQYGAAHNWSSFPDRTAHGNMDYIPWLLQHLQTASTSAGTRLLDYRSVHWYPQGGEFSDDTSTATELLRNQSTRSLWDPAYVDQSWVASTVALIPRLKQWTNTYYPGTMCALTEYNWGAEGSMNGATAQADVDGILGREGCDLATRWTVPDPSTPTYQAMKLYRNYDGAGSGFGDVSVSASVADPDTLAAFAALRSASGALTVMLVHKELTATDVPTIALSDFSPGASCQCWQLADAQSITRLADIPIVGGQLSLSLPPSSVTLLVIPAAASSTTGTGTSTGTGTTTTTTSTGTTATGSTGTTSATASSSSGATTAATAGATATASATGTAASGPGGGSGGCGLGGALAVACLGILAWRRPAPRPR